MKRTGISIRPIVATIGSLALLGALAMIIGCGGRARQDARAGAAADDGVADRPADVAAPMPPTDDRTWQVDRPPPTTAQVQRRPLPVPTGPTLVRQGKAPLVYIVEQAMTVSVVDLSTDQRLARAAVPARTIVRVETRGGVVFGEERITPGPLPADHAFGIYLEPPDAQSGMESQTIAPAPGPRVRQPVRQSEQYEQPEPQRSQP